MLTSQNIIPLAAILFHKTGLNLQLKCKQTILYMSVVICKCLQLGLKLYVLKRNWDCIEITLIEIVNLWNVFYYKILYPNLSHTLCTVMPWPNCNIICLPIPAMTQCVLNVAPSQNFIFCNSVFILYFAMLPTYKINNIVDNICVLGSLFCLLSKVRLFFSLIKTAIWLFGKYCHYFGLGVSNHIRFW